MLKTLFSRRTATLSQTQQGSHIRGNVIHSLALRSSFFHLAPNELVLNYHFASALPFYDSICLSIADFLSRRPRRPGHTPAFISSAAVSGQQVEAPGSERRRIKNPSPTPPPQVGVISRLGCSSVRDGGVGGVGCGGCSQITNISGSHCAVIECPPPHNASVILQLSCEMSTLSAFWLMSSLLKGKRDKNSSYGSSNVFWL